MCGVDPRILGMPETRDGGTSEGMWEERAHRARRDIAALAASGLGVSELHAAGHPVDREITSGPR